MIITPSSSPFCCDLTFSQWSSVIFCHRCFYPRSSPCSFFCPSWCILWAPIKEHSFHLLPTFSSIIAAQHLPCLSQCVISNVFGSYAASVLFGEINFTNNFFSRIVSSTDNRQWVLYSKINVKKAKETEHLHCNGSDIDNEKWNIGGGEWVRGSQGHGGEGYFLAEEEVATKLLLSKHKDGCKGRFLCLLCSNCNVYYFSIGLGDSVSISLDNQYTSLFCYPYP